MTAAFSVTGWLVLGCVIAAVASWLAGWLFEQVCKAVSRAFSRRKRRAAALRRNPHLAAIERDLDLIWLSHPVAKEDI